MWKEAVRCSIHSTVSYGLPQRDRNQEKTSGPQDTSTSCEPSTASWEKMKAPKGKGHVRVIFLFILDPWGICPAHDKDLIDSFK